jgi:hypothetical protein
MKSGLRRSAWLVMAASLLFACKKKQPESTEVEPTDPNRCTYSTPDVKCPEGKFCFVPAKDLAGKDPSKDKIWGTCVNKRANGEECQSADDCADPNASCEESDEDEKKSVCTPD